MSKTGRLVYAPGKGTEGNVGSLTSPRYVCVTCGESITGTMYGAGDGTGQRFRCVECHWRTEATEKDAEIARLTDDLTFLRDDWSPFGARPCPACVYTDGIFVRRCAVHAYADHERTARLEANTRHFDNAREAHEDIRVLEAALEEERTARLAAEGALARMREALEFYADPETYVAISFFPDLPAGDFIDDFNETDLGFKPGKRARAALTSPEGGTTEGPG